jgi:hypothetical protein
MPETYARITIALALLLSITVVGCDDDKNVDTPDETKTATEKTDDDSEKPEQAASEDDGPSVAEKRDELVEDYTAEIEGTITAENAEDIAAELEAEIDADMEKMAQDESGE